ncbi:GNAT family N-acetyltransferase [Herbidospora cretacea]|uniref:GNAT family N-acetyltransferase n=1 Tax=Herbidospora cretacea TaxID=28444 RepID=UPI000773B417|nr:GNAT family N-acetyltransferase [Herbidospora cretacea]
MTAPLRVRRFGLTDLDKVWELHQLGLAQVGLAPGDGVYYDDDLPRIKEVYLDDRGEFLVGELPNGRIAAMGGLRRVDDEVAEMCRLRVHPDHQRRGYGALILETLEERAHELGYSVLRGDTTLQQGAAVSLYRKYGWREVCREERGVSVVLYGEKILTSARSSEFTPR